MCTLNSLSDKNQIEKRRKGNKTLSQKSEKEQKKKNLTKGNKREGTEDQDLIYGHP
jgi:hypothetical protein